MARIAALLRRVDRAAILASASTANTDDRLVVGAVVVDVGTRRVLVGEEEVHLTRTEFDLLTALARRGGRVVERDRLLAEIWDWDPAAAARAVQGGAARTMDSHVKALRRKIGAERIRTVHGVGYALEALS